jgi:hypothetical protein
VRAEDYRYRHFKRGLLREDMAFARGPRPGDPMPDFDLPTADGGRIRKQDFVGREPLLMTFASVTCPMTRTAGPALRKLYEEFGDRVAFVSLYVREAHPGERFPQPDELDRKMRHADDYRWRDDIPWPVAVDDIDGTLHQMLDPKPNAAYIVDADGTVAFRALWSNEERPLRRALDAVTHGRAPLREGRARMVPMVRGIGAMADVLPRDAQRDVRREALPVYALARIARLFRPLPPLARGIAAMAFVAGAVAGAGVAVWWARSREASVTRTWGAS